MIHIMPCCYPDEIAQQKIHELNFRNTEELLLYHKYLYYEVSKPMITDGHFDQMEKYAQKLSQYVDKEKFPEEQWVWKNMVGFQPSHPLWAVVCERFRIKWGE